MSDNPAMDAERHQAEQDEKLKLLPICAECGEYIQQESAVNIGGDLYCDSCLDILRKSID